MERAVGAFSGDSEAAPGVGWSELSGSDYQKLWYSDDNRFQVTSSVNGANAVLLIGFKIESRENAVKQVTVSFEGYGTAPNGNGVTLKIWNHTATAWQNPQTTLTNGADATVTRTVTSNLIDLH